MEEAPLSLLSYGPVRGGRAPPPPSRWRLGAAGGEGAPERLHGPRPHAVQAQELRLAHPGELVEVGVAGRGEGPPRRAGQVAREVAREVALVIVIAGDTARRPRA